MLTALYILCSIGFLLSLYAVYCHVQATVNPEFKSVCDLSDKASCTKAFTSAYGSHFGIPNGYFGMLFYVVMAGLLWFGFLQYFFWLSVLSVVASCYLAFILVTKIKAACLDCIAVYIVNICSAVLSYLLLFA